MPSSPFQLINRSISSTDDKVYMVECMKYNSDRDSYLLRRVFLDLDSASRFQDKLWKDEMKGFDQFTDWSGSTVPSGKTASDYVYVREAKVSDQPNQFGSHELYYDYIGWDLQALAQDQIITEDALGEMNWEFDYGLTTGYSIVILKWDAENNRYG